MMTKLTSPADDDDARSAAIARTYAQTEVRSAQTIQQYQGGSRPCPTAHMRELDSLAGLG